MKNYVTAIIQCPFFKSERKNLLCCEGFIEGTCMTTAFSSRQAALNYISDNCSHKDGGRCPLAMNLFGKYEALREAEEKAEKEWQEKLMRIKGLQHTGHNFLQSRTVVN